MIADSPRNPSSCSRANTCTAAAAAATRTSGRLRRLIPIKNVAAHPATATATSSGCTATTAAIAQAKPTAHHGAVAELHVTSAAKAATSMKSTTGEPVGDAPAAAAAMPEAAAMNDACIG
ncbi:unannotated protein [freshwater metagenome]|uniref:Unannotated protein n=1 Tax=freshwater metagenome TaxID=449393 RepID=A0A6J6Q0A0_9ZZZZ